MAGSSPSLPAISKDPTPHRKESTSKTAPPPPKAKGGSSPQPPRRHSSKLDADIKEKSASNLGSNSPPSNAHGSPSSNASSSSSISSEDLLLPLPEKSSPASAMIGPSGDLLPVVFGPPKPPSPISGGCPVIHGGMSLPAHMNPHSKGHSGYRSPTEKDIRDLDRAALKEREPATILEESDGSVVSGSVGKRYKEKKKSTTDDDTKSYHSDSSGYSAGLMHMFEQEELEDSVFDDMEAISHLDDTQMRRQLTILRKVNHFTRDIAENSNQAIVVVNASSKRIFWVNNRAQIMFGKLEDDLVNQNVNILIPDEIARKHDKFIDNFLTMWAKDRFPPFSKVVNPRTPREIKAVRYMSDGSKSLFEAEMFVRSMKTRSMDKPPALFVAYINDITEMKSLKHQLNLSKVIQHKSAESIVVCDLSGQISNCNSMAEQMFGTSLSFLLAHNKNIKWFMPKSVADRHDGYLSAFRDNLQAGYDVQKSTIIGKARNMKGRRPGDQEDELFSIVLRVELVGTELVAYIRDTSDTITKAEFDEAITGKVFPRCIKNKILRTQVDPYEICEQLPKKTIVYTDLSNFTRYSNGTDVLDVYKYVNSMYKAFDHMIPQYGGELVKRTGDGIIAMFGLEGKASRHADRAVYCSIAMLHWAIENGYNMRVGVASGDVGSGVFGDAESRPAWDVLGECVNLASRMQSYGAEGKIQISEQTYNSFSDPRLTSLFTSKTLDDVKGYGQVKCYLSTTAEYSELQPLLLRRAFEIDHERKRILEREKRLLELGQM